jgi:hypothetical protein
VSLPADQHSEMLQSHAGISLIPQQLGLGAPHGLVERQNCLRWHETTPRIDDAEHGSLY